MVRLLAVGLVLLGLGWMAATEPLSAPDEAAHYLRALNIANGHLLGPKTSLRANPGVPADQFEFLQHNTRGVIVPARLAPPGTQCRSTGQPLVAGSCLVTTYEGNFPPLPYLLPAAGIAASHHVLTAAWLTRVASALQSLAFLVLAVCLLWRRTPWSLLGLSVAVTPMVLFVSSVLNPSGLETTSGLAFAAAALRIGSDGERASPWVWGAFGISGLVLVVSWPLGIVFGAATLGVLVLLIGFSGLRALHERHPRGWWFAVAALVVSAVVWLVYSRIAGLGSGTFSITPLWPGLHQGLEMLGPVLRQAVGDFGALSVPLPESVYWIWWLLVLAVVVAALWLGTMRQRLALVALVAFDVAFPVLFYAWFERFTGFGLAGREVLSLLLLVPLVAGEIVYLQRDAFARQRWPEFALAGVLLLVAALQAYAWWDSARSAAGAPGTIRFYAHAIWTPPGGWWVWIALAGAGVLALLGFGVAVAARSMQARGAPALGEGAPS